MECIEVLARAGADVKARDDNGLTALMLATASASTAAVQAVLDVDGSEMEAKDAERGFTAFLWACNEGSTECIRALAAAGCDTTVTDSTGTTGLMVAANSGAVAAVEAVLDVGVSALEAKDGELRSAYLEVVSRG